MIVMNLGAFLAVGVYQGIWRYTSVADFVTFAKGVVLGTGLSVLTILLLYRFQGFSRAVFVIFGVFMLVALAGSRMAFKLFRQLLPNPMKGKGRRVMIYGAGDGGEMVLRELQNNPEWDYRPIGFIDDDPKKKDKVVHGLKVYSPNGSLGDICDRNDIEEILISFRELPPERLAEVREECASSHVILKRALIKIETI
jgi:UDP-GlcNAc:undecaprenyl-phosphate GlcNAc-1-phosphate transferase